MIVVGDLGHFKWNNNVLNLIFCLKTKNRFHLISTLILISNFFLSKHAFFAKPFERCVVVTRSCLTQLIFHVHIRQPHVMSYRFML